MKIARTLTVLSAMVLVLLAQGKESVFYQPMLTAYDEGRVEEARQLARGFLEQSRREIQISVLDVDRDGSARRALDLVQAIMDREAQFAPAARFNNHTDLMTVSQDVIRMSQDSVARIARPVDAVRQYFTGKIGAASRAWISSAGPRLPRDQVQRVFQQFEPQMREAGGPTDLDTILRNGSQPRKPAVQKATPRAAGIGNLDGNAILAVIRNYYDAVLAGDAAKLAAVTGMPTQSASALIARRKDNFSRVQVRDVSRVTLPHLTGTQVADLLRARPDGAYDLYLQGIETVVVDENGAAGTRTVEKLFTLKRTAGRWTVVAPQQGGQQQ